MSRLDYDGLRDDVAEVLRTLEPLERRVSRRDGTAHYLLRILPYRTPDSTVDGSLVTFVDVTRIVQAEQHQRLLVDELNHRVKNMLAVVISLATQTLRRSGTLEEFSGVFLGRVHALTAAYALLSRENWSQRAAAGDRRRRSCGRSWPPTAPTSASRDRPCRWTRAARWRWAWRSTSWRRTRPSMARCRCLRGMSP